MKNIFHVSGPALKAARKALKGVTQKMVAEAIGISRETYTNWEAKESIEVDAETLNSLKKTLKVQDDVITIVPHGTKKNEGDLADHPLVKSYVEQINLQKKLIEMLEKDLADCRGKK